MVQSLLRRVNWERGTISRHDLALDGENLQVLKNSKHAAYLSREQFSCLSLLLEKSPAFVSEGEIIAAVYAGDPDKAEALHSLMYRLRKSLGARLGRRIKCKRKQGWIYVQPRAEKRPGPGSAVRT